MNPQPFASRVISMRSWRSARGTSRPEKTRGGEVLAIDVTRYSASTSTCTTCSRMDIERCA